MSTHAQENIGRYRAAVVVDKYNPCGGIATPPTFPLRLFWIDTTTMGSTAELVFEEGPENVELVAPTSGALLGVGRNYTTGRYELSSLRFRQSAEVLATFDEPGTVFRGVADASGNFYYLTGRAGGAYLVTVSKQGLRGAVLLPGGASYTGIDLAADQCTLYLSRLASPLAPAVDMLRYNVCTNTVSGTIPISNERDVTVLPGGDLLVASGRRYTPDGTLVRTYTLPQPVGTLALTAGGRGFMAGYRCRTRDYEEIDLETGAIVATLSLGFEGSPSLVLLDGWTAAVGPLAISDVPTLSTYALLAMAIVTAAVALSRFRS